MKKNKPSKETMIADMLQVLNSEYEAVKDLQTKLELIHNTLDSMLDSMSKGEWSEIQPIIEDSYEMYKLKNSIKRILVILEDAGYIEKISTELD